MVPALESAHPPYEFKDRKTGLVIFGFLTILLGGLCALMVPFLVWMNSLAARGGNPQSIQTMILGMLIYGAMAVALVWLGIGSMMARRWARALLLIFAWSWLIVGTIPFGAIAFITPRVLKVESEVMQDLRASPEIPIPPELSQIFAPMFAMLVLAVIFLIWPGVWVLFYRSGHVKATCEARDPVVRWTDRSPLPVIAACLWLIMGAEAMLEMAVEAHGAAPVFGMFVAGPLGSAIYLLGAVIWSYSAWALYKLDGRGWWLVFGSLLLCTISAFLTYSRHDMSEWDALTGHPGEQIAPARDIGFLKGRPMAWASLLGAVPLLGYLLYVRRFFHVPREG